MYYIDPDYEPDPTEEEYNRQHYKQNASQQPDLIIGGSDDNVLDDIIQGFLLRHNLSDIPESFNIIKQYKENKYQKRTNKLHDSYADLLANILFVDPTMKDYPPLDISRYNLANTMRVESIVRDTYIPHIAEYFNILNINFDFVSFCIGNKTDSMAYSILNTTLIIHNITNRKFIEELKVVILHYEDAIKELSDKGSVDVNIRILPYNDIRIVQHIMKAIHKYF